MHAYKLRMTIPEEPSREIAVRLPDDFPAGPAEVIVLAEAQNDCPYQPTDDFLHELLSFGATPEEAEILKNFEFFRKQNAIQLR